MQTIEQNGYTKQEILDALQFKSGSRTITFRYEQLDYTNTKIRDMSNVISASIAQTYTDDVKRTAKFTVLDDNTINFASDRIKPWCRIAMPSKSSLAYKDVAAQYNLIKTGEYLFNEGSSYGALAIANTGISGTAYNGSITSTGGFFLLEARASIAEGSSFQFQTNTTTAGIVTIPNGSDFFHKASGAFTVLNSVSHTIFINWQGTGTQYVWRTSDGSTSLQISAGTITLTLKTGSSTITCTCNNTYGGATRFIGFSWALGSNPVLYLNGLPQTTTMVTSDISNQLAPTGDIQIGYGMTGYLDAPTWYNSALSAQDMADIYRSGVRTGPFGPNNYAEWSQGVFLLTSPSRGTDHQGVVTRDIAAYDMTQAYVDDVVDTRYTAQIGTLYINNILGLLMNNVPKSLGLQDQNVWNYFGATNYTFSSSGTSAVVPGQTDSTLANGGNIRSNQVYSIANADFIANMTLPTSGSGTGLRLVAMNAEIGSDQYAWGYWPWQTNSLVVWLIINGSQTTPFSIPYNSATHAYLRIQESRGYITFQTSADAVTWVTQYTIASPSYFTPTSFQFNENITSGTSPAWSFTINSTSLTAALVPTNFNVTSSGLFLPQSKSYDPGTTKLAIINDLLSCINYEPLVFDESGNPVVKPYVVPSSRPPEYVYADDAASVTLPEMTETFDLYGVPNKWVLAASNPDSTLFTATYINSNPLSPSSTISRGRTITHYELETDVADLVTLQGRALAMANAASQVYDQMDFTTAIMPFHSANDVYGLSYGSLGVFDKFSEISWSFDCSEGALMKHSARRQVQV